MIVDKASEKEIDELTDFIFDFEPVRNGRGGKVVSVDLIMTRKNKINEINPISILTEAEKDDFIDTIEDIIDIKTIVSEAVSNAIIHGYQQNSEKEVFVSATLSGKEVILTIKDDGVGIENIVEALRINYSSKNRSGLGFSIIKSLCDDLQVKSKKDLGTKLIIKKVLTIKGI